jgi:hypothetical protein
MYFDKKKELLENQHVQTGKKRTRKYVGLLIFVVPGGAAL